MVSLIDQPSIMLPIYAAAAEADVVQRDAALATRTGDDLEHARRAAIYFCAARLAPAVPDIVQQTFFDYRYTKAARDIAADVDRLTGLAESELAAMTGYGGDLTAIYPVSHFGVAKATRGQW
jgi:hypothetical protein